ncbi:MAG: RagB/SusD family nutrient uptake outer membrane protein, partial [Prevotellaceae bacterium]|nr:RagB/SusD family nutrient uptake outer membrane protein [Prevotellaceae bacterium]
MKLKRLILLPVSLLWAAACSNLLDVQNENTVDADKHYNNYNDADNAILGIYGKLLGLADRVIILNELRADLMDITPNATADMTAISNHTATPDNVYCDLAPFYEVILNCNDVLVNFDRMRSENKLSRADYEYRYADVVTVRCWVYLQLAIHFGSIPYITDPLPTVDDLEDLSKFPALTFDEVLQKLVDCMAAVPVKNLSSSSPFYNSVADGYNMNMLFLNKKLMLADLYLWSDRYTEAAECYYSVISEAEMQLFSGSENYAYKVDGYVWDGTNEPRFQVCYVRYKGADLSSYRNKWKEIFSRSSTDGELRREMITLWCYDARFAPQYPLVELFANTGKGKYYLKPSQWAIDSLWEAQVQRENSFVFDGRGREASFDYVNGQPVVAKYLYDYYPQVTDNNRTIHLEYNSLENEYARQGKWFIYRAGLLHLRYAEAANRAGYPDLAYALINDGIRDHFDWTMSNGASKRTDKEGVQYSGYPPAGDDEMSEPYPFPFYLDGRFNDVPYVYLRSPWRDSYGIRRRAWVQNVPKPEWVSDRDDSIRWMEEAILKEAALECGFEGHRWGDML